MTKRVHKVDMSAGFIFKRFDCFFFFFFDIKFYSFNIKSMW